MLTPKATVSNVAVLAHGSLVASRDDACAIHPFGDDYKISINVIYNAPAAPGYTVTNVGQRGVLLQFNAQGFPGDLATGTPAYVANYQGRKLLMTVAIQLIGFTDHSAATKIINYTLLDGGPI